MSEEPPRQARLQDAPPGPVRGDSVDNGRAAAGFLDVSPPYSPDPIWGTVFPRPLEARVLLEDTMGKEHTTRLVVFTQSGGGRKTSSETWCIRLGFIGGLVAALVATSAVGNEWSAPRAINNDFVPDLSEPVLLVTDEGETVAAWIETDFQTYSKLVLSAWSSEGDPLWGPVHVNSAGSPSGPAICEDRRGDIHVAWVDDRFSPAPGDQSDAFYSKFAMDGTLVVDNLRITSNGRGEIGSMRATDDRVHVVVTTRVSLLYLALSLEGELVVSKNMLGDLGVPPHYIVDPRIFPAADGTAAIVYIDWMERSPTTISQAFWIRIDADGSADGEPRVISHPDSRTYSELEADADSSGNIHFILYETPFEDPIPDRMTRRHYGQLGRDGQERTTLWEFVPPNVFEGYEIVVDDFDRPVAFLVDRLSANPGRGVTWQTNRRIVQLVLDPVAQEASRQSRVAVGGLSVRNHQFARDKRGGFVGLYPSSESFPIPTYDLELVATVPERYCRLGTSTRPRLLVNGTAGDAGGNVSVSRGEPIVLSILGDERLPEIGFYIRASVGVPQRGGVFWDSRIGLSCFDLRRPSSAVAIWNGLGRLHEELGTSRILDRPIPDPTGGPGIFYTIPGPKTETLPVGERFTLQGICSDLDTRSGYSVTNALVVSIGE